MAKKIIRTGFMTEIDRFLRNFDNNRTQFPESRIKECEKFKIIYQKRDQVVTEEESPIWKNF